MNNFSIRKSLCVATAVTLAGVMPTFAADYVMKIGFVTINDQNHEWATMYEEAVEAGSGGRIDVQVYPASQLGPVPRQIEGAQLGTVEAVMFPTDFFVGIDAKYGVFSIPGLFKDMKNAAETIADPELNEEILALGEPYGLVGLSTFVYAASDYFGMEPIRKLEDFKDLKFRINATPAERERMQILGSTAVPMPFPDVLPALQRGTVDATQSAIPLFVNFKFNTIGKTITQTDDTMLVIAAVVSKAWLDTLPTELQTLVVNEGRKLQTHVQSRSFEVVEAMRTKWKAEGGEIITLPADEQAELMRLLEPVGETVTKDNAPVNAFFNSIKEVASQK